MLRNIPEGRRSHLLRGESLKSSLEFVSLDTLRTLSEHSQNTRRTLSEQQQNTLRTIAEHSQNNRRTLSEHSQNRPTYRSSKHRA